MTKQSDWNSGWPKANKQALSKFFVEPENFQNVKRYLRKASFVHKPKPSFHDLLEDNEHEKILRGLYDDLCEEKIHYQEPDTGSDPNEYQPIKTPKSILDSKSGTCVDLTLLFASVCAHAGLIPIIVILEYDYGRSHVLLIIRVKSKRGVYRKYTETDYKADNSTDENKIQWSNPGSGYSDANDESSVKKIQSFLERQFKEQNYIAIECTGFAWTKNWDENRKEPKVLSFERAIENAKKEIIESRDIKDIKSLFLLDLKHRIIVSKDLPYHPPDVPRPRKRPDRELLKPRAVFLRSSLVTVILMLVRFFGLIQPLELAFYDHLISTRRDKEPDDRILIVAAEDADITRQKENEEELEHSFSDETLLTVLKKASSLNPIAIGLDIYRENASPEILRFYESHKSILFAACLENSANYDRPPKNFPGHIGFSNFAHDTTKEGPPHLRRHLLAMGLHDNSICNTNYSFSLLLANEYLKKKATNETPPLIDKYYFYDPFQKIEHGNGEEVLFCKNLEFRNGVVFPNFKLFTGGYQFANDYYGGCQVLLNYRRKSLKLYDDNDYDNFQERASAEIVSIHDFLSKSFPINAYQGRIILVGIRNEKGSIPDLWSTPYGKSLYGVEIQAQMIGAIIDAVEGDRPLLRVLPQWGSIQWAEHIFIIIGAIIITCHACLYRFDKYAFFFEATTLVIFYGVCRYLFSGYGLWLPFVPTFLTAVFIGILFWVPSEILLWIPNRLLKTL